MPVFAAIVIAAGLVLLAWTSEETALAYAGGAVAALVLIAIAGAELYQRRFAARGGSRVAPEAAVPEAVPEVVVPEAVAPEAVDAEVRQDAAGEVHVIPGRRRYHSSTCTLLAGREQEVLALEDAIDEGFTACSVCSVGARPDRGDARTSTIEKSG